MKREPGYYWIFYYNQWTIGEWIVPKNGIGFWQVIGNELDFHDKEFEKIDETTRILRP